MPKNNMIVSKFGGTSMADAVAIRRSAQVATQQNTNIVVVSATYGTTNQLISLAEKAENGSNLEREKVLDELKEKHRKIAKDLNCEAITIEKIEELLSEAETLSKGIALLKECSPKAMDRLLSIGERLSSHLMAKAMREEMKKTDKDKICEFFDVRKVLKTDDRHGQASPLLEKIKTLAKDLLSEVITNRAIYITQGFIASSLEGNTTTLGRGGSDYSAALLAEAIQADRVEIWTDVAGIATTDPRICPQAKAIDQITFQEAAELATFGAKILHPTTLAPALRANIPVFVGSSYESDKKGTWIHNDCEDKPLVRAMALKKEQNLLTLTTPKMLNTHGFMAKIFSVFDKHQVSVDAITTSEISVAMTVDHKTLLDKEFLAELQEHAELKKEENLALVSLIGNNINHTAGLAQKIFTAVQDGSFPINVRMICLGASKHNFCFLVPDQQAKEVIMRLHRNFIE
jgi:aspartate kinase